MPEDFYVNIENPPDVRRKLLETSKDVVLALQKFEKFKINRVKRLENYDMLRKNISEINELISRLKKELPVIRIPKVEAKPLPKVVKAQKQQRQIVSMPALKRTSSAEKLEKELSEIESKLKALQ